jgi:hypothetical protein
MKLGAYKSGVGGGFDVEKVDFCDWVFVAKLQSQVE